MDKGGERNGNRGIELVCVGTGEGKIWSRERKGSGWGRQGRETVVGWKGNNNRARMKTVISYNDKKNEIYFTYTFPVCYVAD